MGAGTHSVSAQTFFGRKAMVVREQRIMTKNNKPIKGIPWADIFKRRPDLNPPGYYETIEKLYPKEGQAND